MLERLDTPPSSFPEIVFLLLSSLFNGLNGLNDLNSLNGVSLRYKATGWLQRSLNARA
jgi:hypothetical protein